MEDLEPGLIIDDRYEVRRQLGRGGMSTIYEVEHRYTTRRLALKVLNATYASHAVARRQLLDEARALGAVRHPYVIEVHDAGFDGSRVYVVTELLEGRSLDGLLAARGRLAWSEVARVARHVTIALAASHGVGVLHRDVKPSNVMIVRGVQGELSKLLDFGVAALPRAPGEAASAGAEMLVGTPEYMSPEQLRGDAIDARSDLYALGITMFECLQGEVPMPGGLDVAHQRASVPSLPPVSMVCDDVPKALADIVDRLLHPVAAFRFPSARSLLDALDASGLCRTPTRFLDDAPPEAVAGRPTASGRRPGQGEAEPAGAARRRSARAYYQTPLRVMTAAGAVIDGRSEDISSGGMLVIAGTPLPEGERVVVRFALPASGNMVQCSAVVNWSRHRAATQRGRAAFGLAFVDAPPAMTEAIARYAELMQREG
ncbi:MAG: protein kinase [Deltaproteobacteria bacterium]|nr:protein kinase [Myxococcales bacterium]MDP3213179.1 protein kinase [Deltaproteobacteria bacterium]